MSVANNNIALIVFNTVTILLQNAKNTIMDSTKPYSDPDKERDGHVVCNNDTTVSSQKQNEPAQTKGIKYTILIEHTFCTEVESGTSENLNFSYHEFTQDIAKLFHGNHNMEHIHTALILAEDHLTIILEDNQALDKEYLRFIERAISFIRKYLARIVGFATNTEVKSENMSKDKKGTDAPIFKWNGKFTELVELLSALFIGEYIGSTYKSEFIRSIFKTLGVKKTMNDYYKTLRKMEEKTPKEDDAPKRCVILPRLLRLTENAWQEKYLCA